MENVYNFLLLDTLIGSPGDVIAFGICCFIAGCAAVGITIGYTTERRLHEAQEELCHLYDLLNVPASQRAVEQMFDDDSRYHGVPQRHKAAHAMLEENWDALIEANKQRLDEELGNG